MRIASGDDGIVREEHDGKRSTNLAERVDNPGQQRIGSRMSNQVNDDFTVGCRLKNCAVGFEFVAEDLRIDEIAIVCQREVAECEVDRERLDILEILAA